MPKGTVTAGDDAECLCIFGGATRCWVPARTQRAVTPMSSLPSPPNKLAANANPQQALERVLEAQSEAAEIPEPTATVNDGANEPDPRPTTTKPAAVFESEVGQGAHDDVQQHKGNALQLAQRKYAPIKMFTLVHT